MFVLLNWACGIYTVCVKQNESFSSSPPFKGLVGSIAVLLDMVLESSKSKDSLKNGALARTRRALRSVSATINAVAVFFFGEGNSLDISQGQQFLL